MILPTEVQAAITAVEQLTPQHGQMLRQHFYDKAGFHDVQPKPERLLSLSNLKIDRVLRIFNFALTAQLESPTISAASTLALLRDEEFMSTVPSTNTIYFDEVSDEQITSALSIYLALQWDDLDKGKI